MKRGSESRGKHFQSARKIFEQQHLSVPLTLGSLLSPFISGSRSRGSTDLGATNAPGATHTPLPKHSDLLEGIKILRLRASRMDLFVRNYHLGGLTQRPRRIVYKTVSVLRARRDSEFATVAKTGSAFITITCPIPRASCTMNKLRYRDR